LSSCACKGIIFEGEFTPDSHAREISKAPHLQGPSSKVTVRFSDFSGIPTIPDNDPMSQLLRETEVAMKSQVA
jgi:catalase